MKEKKQDSGKYIRVGTTLYKIVRRPLISGDYIEDKIVWSYTFYHIGTDGELFPLKRKGRYFEVSRLVVEKILL